MTQHELVNDIYGKNRTLIDELISKSKYPLTFDALKNFVAKLEDLKIGLAVLEKQETFYSSQSLARVLTEHFLVAYYIFTKCRLDGKDDCANDYLRYYPIFEMIKRENYNSKLNKTYDSTKTPLGNFLIGAPEFTGKIEEADIPDLNRRANQFDIRNILKYVQNDVPVDDAFKGLDTIVHNDCRKYNDTSTYIHAGRLAELQYLENSPVTDKKKVASDNTQLAEIYATQVLSFVMLLLIIENPEFVEVYQPVIEFIQQKKKPNIL